MPDKAVPFDVELIIAGRDVVESEASLIVRDCCTEHRLVGMQQRNGRTAHSRAIRILNRARDLPLRFPAKSDYAREDGADDRCNEFHMSREMYRPAETTTSRRNQINPQATQK